MEILYYMCIYLNLSTYIDIGMYICLPQHTHILLISTHTHTYSICIYICMYICVHIYVLFSIVIIFLLKSSNRIEVLRAIFEANFLVA